VRDLRRRRHGGDPRRSRPGATISSSGSCYKARR
jgi:hypothetical protein